VEINYGGRCVIAARLMMKTQVDNAGKCVIILFVSIIYNTHYLNVSNIVVTLDNLDRCS
jgi:hypothetical protein